MLYEGKAKIIYATEHPGLLVMKYKDEATALDGAKKGTIANKGPVSYTHLDVYKRQRLLGTMGQYQFHDHFCTVTKDHARFFPRKIQLVYLGGEHDGTYPRRIGRIHSAGIPTVGAPTCFRCCCHYGQ